jgi:hypothetical protein
MEGAPTAFTHMLGKMFCGPTHPRSQWQDGKTGRQKNEEMTLRRDMLKTDHEWGKEKQPVDHDAPALDSRREWNNCPDKNQSMC